MLIHEQYVATLPPPSQLMATVVWSDREVELLQGTNLYEATLARQRDLRKEWKECEKGFHECLGIDKRRCCTW
jgi:hypothetical protein